jgi:hypothetical protein
MRIQRLSFVALSLLCVAGCTSVQQYRKTSGAIPPIAVSDLETRKDVDDGHGSKGCSERLFRDRSIEKFHTPEGEVFTIGVIELSDDGHVKDIRQRDEVFRELKRVARGGDAATAASPGAVVVTFVHGWHHRAKVCDENLSCYRRVMEGLVARKDDRANKGPVFGIYIGWRGESAHRLTPLTFYNRKAAAHHVGSLGGRDLLLELGQMQRDLDREVREASGGSRYVNMATVGHSFGGALVYSAMESLSVSEYAGAHGVGYPACKGGAKPVRSGVGDLVVLVNPAFEAKRYQYFAEDVAAPGPYSPDQRPVLLTVASTADQAAGIAFPLGRALWLAWHPGAWRDGRAEITGLGHYAPYTTHRLIFNGPAEKPVEAKPLTDEAALKRCDLLEEQKAGLVRATCDCSYPVYKQTPTAKAGDIGAPLPGRSQDPTELKEGGGSVHALKEDVTLQAIDAANKHVPYIVASAPGNLISGHNDIYNPNFILFLIGYINNNLPGPGLSKPASEEVPTCR